MQVRVAKPNLVSLLQRVLLSTNVPGIADASDLSGVRSLHATVSF